MFEDIKSQEIIGIAFRAKPVNRIHILSQQNSNRNLQNFGNKTFKESTEIEIAKFTN